jgi:hypothetical protein
MSVNSLQRAVTSREAPLAKIVIPDDAWQPFDENEPEWDGSRLYAIVLVNGIKMHVEAHAVQDAAGLQTEDGRWSEYSVLCDGFDQAWRCRTVMIRGRHYVLFAIAGADLETPS